MSAGVAAVLLATTRTFASGSEDMNAPLLACVDSCKRTRAARVARCAALELRLRREVVHTGPHYGRRPAGAARGRRRRPARDRARGHRRAGATARGDLAR